MGIINGLEDYNIFTNKLNIDILRDSEPNLIFHFIATFLLCRKTPSACYLFSGVGAATSGFCVLIAIFHHFFTR